MKIKTEIEIDELVTLRQAVLSLETLIRILNNIEGRESKAFANDVEIAKNSKKILDDIIKRS